MNSKAQASNDSNSGSTSERFRRMSHSIAQAMGTPLATALAMASIVAWAACGPIFDYSENWQLVINTATTIITFLMVFFIQNTQNRDSRELHLKLNELIRSLDTARNEVIDCDNLSDEDLNRLEAELHKLSERYGEPVAHLHAHVSHSADKRAAKRRHKKQN
jgi:low affinity Fe/Cu permease